MCWVEDGYGGWTINTPVGWKDCETPPPSDEEGTTEMRWLSPPRECYGCGRTIAPGGKYWIVIARYRFATRWEIPYCEECIPNNTDGLIDQVPPEEEEALLKFYLEHCYRRVKE